ncbi:MAG TPA: ComEA family DNA-binding protein [Candidatus Binatia bacterium]|nr:ComEA family DNA-binding protein [Candidatus Binatia bacterium]
MWRFRRAVAAGLFCGLALAAGGRGVRAAETSPRINLNTASVQELARLPGIGPAKAEAIVQHRAQHPFAKAEDLREVKGIGEKLYERIKDQVTVGDAPPAPKGRGG